MIIVNARFLTQQTTGVQRYAIEISLQLKNILKDKIIFVAPTNILQYEIAHLLDVKLIGNFKGHLWEQLDLVYYLRKNNSPYLLNLTGLSPLLYNKTIMMVPDMSFMRHPEWFSFTYRLVYNYLYPINIKKAKRIITISEFSKKEIYDFFPKLERKIMITYCSISNIFNNLTNKQFYNFNYILAVSSLDPRKNFLKLVQAFNSMNTRDIKLVIVGSENRLFANELLKEELSKNKNIILTGYVNDDDLKALYTNAKCFIYPSIYEGFGIPPLEAMACGTPVIASDISSLPEVCGEAAYYIDPFDQNSIAKGIEKLLYDDDLCKSLIINGYMQLSKFSWKSSAEKIKLLLEEYE